MVGGRVEPGAADVVVLPKKQAWEAAFGGQQAARPHVRARLAGWPERLLAPRPPSDETDRQFLTRLARDTWRGLAALVDREHACRSTTSGWAPSRASATTPTSPRRALPDRHRRGARPRAGRRRARRRSACGALATLERLETHAGFFFNYYDTTTLERSSDFVSFVDSAWLTAGPDGGAPAFPELARRATRLIDAHGLRLLLRRDARAHVARLLRPPPGAARGTTTGSSTPRRGWGAASPSARATSPRRTGSGWSAPSGGLQLADARAAWTPRAKAVRGHTFFGG